MPSSQTTKIGTSLVLGATILAVGIFSGTRINKLDSNGQMDRANEIYADAPVLAPCTATGGKANYNTCYFANPFTVPALVKNFQLHAVSNPAGAGFDCGPVSALSASGNTIVDSVVPTDQGATSGAIVRSPNDIFIPVSGYLKCVANKNPTAAFEAVMLTTITEYHSL